MYTGLDHMLSKWMTQDSVREPHSNMLRYHEPIHEAIETMANDEDRNVYLISTAEYYSSTENEYMYTMKGVIIYIIDLVRRFVPMDAERQDDLAYHLCRDLYGTYGYFWDTALENYFEEYGSQEEWQAVGMDLVFRMYNIDGFVPSPRLVHEQHHSWLPALFNHHGDSLYFSDELDAPHVLGKARKQWAMHLLQKDGEALSYLELMPNFCFDLKSQGVDWRNGCLDAGRVYIEGFKHGMGECVEQDVELVKTIQQKLDADPLRPIEELLEELMVYYPRPR